MKNFFWRWLQRLPSQFSSAGWKAGYVYELAFRQFEISDTYVFDRPQAGRMWFERVIRDHLDVGRPDQVMLIFDRRLEPLCSGSMVLEGVDLRYPGLRNRAPGLRPTGMPSGLLANPPTGGLCDAESKDALPAPDVVTFHQVTRPSNSEDGLYTPALRFGDPRVMAVLASLVGFCHLVEGFHK